MTAGQRAGRHRGSRLSEPPAGTACLTLRRALQLFVVFAVLGLTMQPASAQQRGRASEKSPGSARRANESAAAEGKEVGRSGKKVKVFEFSGLDISGELKSPQLLYFLNRMRTEFSRPRLPHRSFMPELRSTGKSEVFGSARGRRSTRP